MHESIRILQNETRQLLSYILIVREEQSCWKDGVDNEF